ncbi:MAG: carboxypeptidase regulatory-like domain-containing protein [Acidobacteriaceae bacterium]|nr:carboxypeptidase regulatory-like domain-containing protein [Acidobacteriaceae bacterium]
MALSAFAIAALLSLYATFRKKPTAASRQPPWVLIAVIALLALAPIGIDAYLQHEKTAIAGIYRLRVTVVDPRNVPVEDATVRVTAANESKTAPDGSAELAIPRGSMPQDGKVTVYAQKDSAFLHGNKEMTLGGDMNPSTTITIAPNRTAPINGTVEDQTGHAIPGVRVGIAGTTSIETDAGGNFRIPNAGSLGQKVLLHAEKRGYTPVSQYHPAGDEPVVLILTRER